MEQTLIANERGTGDGERKEKTEGKKKLSWNDIPHRLYRAEDEDDGGGGGDEGKNER